MGRPLKYTEEFRREAVELFLSGDRPRSRVAESLGIHGNRCLRDDQV
jgi:transposase-like protein